MPDDNRDFPSFVFASGLSGWSWAEPIGHGPFWNAAAGRPEPAGARITWRTQFASTKRSRHCAGRRGSCDPRGRGSPARMARFRERRGGHYEDYSDRFAMQQPPDPRRNSVRATVGVPDYALGTSDGSYGGGEWPSDTFPVPGREQVCTSVLVFAQESDCSNYRQLHLRHDQPHDVWIGTLGSAWIIRRVSFVIHLRHRARRRTTNDQAQGRRRQWKGVAHEARPVTISSGARGLRRFSSHAAPLHNCK
jgi:hypothetical protein